MKVYCVANQKGGIGKTTTALATASILKKKGYKTLLIDGDYQCNSTDNYRAKHDGVATLYDVILEDDDNRTPIMEAIQHTEYGDILASDPLVRKADVILNNNVEGLFYLKDAISELEGYDYVIIDTHPDINAILHSALIASDEVIIPLFADRFSVQGLDGLIQNVQRINKRQNPNLKIAGFLMTDYDARLNISKETITALRGLAEKLGTKVFNTTISHTVRVKESQGAREPLIEYAPYCSAALNYKSFVEELIGEK